MIPFNYMIFAVSTVTAGLADRVSHIAASDSAPARMPAEAQAHSVLVISLSPSFDGVFLIYEIATPLLFHG